MLTIKRFLCFRLRTAGLLVGWVGTILSFLSTIIFCTILIRLDDVVHLIVGNVSSSQASEHVKTILTVVLAISMTVNVVSLVSSILLIVGTLQKRHLMLVPWLINNGFVLAIQIIVFTLSTLSVIAQGLMSFQLALLLVVDTIILLFQYLIWTAIYSLYHQIRVEGDQEELIPNRGRELPLYQKF